MNINLGLVLAIAAGLLVVAGGMGAALAFVFPRLFPLPPLPAEEKAAAEPVDKKVLAAPQSGLSPGHLRPGGAGDLDGGRVRRRAPL